MQINFTDSHSRGQAAFGTWFWRRHILSCFCFQKGHEFGKIKWHWVKEGTGHHDCLNYGILKLVCFQYFCTVTAGHSEPTYLNTPTANSCQPDNSLYFVLVAAVSAVTSSFYTIRVSQCSAFPLDY